MERWRHLNHRFSPIDELDVRILARLLTDSRRSNMEIARELGTTEGTVRRRVKVMQATGVIRSFSIEIGYGLIENPVKAYVAMRAEKNDRSRLIRRLSGHPRCIALYGMAGGRDLMAVMVFANASELKDFRERQAKAEGIKAVAVQVVETAYKGMVWSGA